jgi:hypothetical protein
MCYNISREAIMNWNPELVKYWCDNYQSLITYELNPFEEIGIFMNEYFTRGSRVNSAPYEDTCDMNYDFDQALKKLGPKEKKFKRLYIDGGGEDLTLFNEFVRILMEVSKE